MSNLTIFKQEGAVSTAHKRELSELQKSLLASSTNRRIQTNTNGTFRRIVNGEQIGKAIRSEFNAIIVDALPKVSRSFYVADYDPEAKPTLPDCWSNLGDKPEAAAPNPQHTNCADCPRNVVGSGKGGKGRACRFQRRIALLLMGDMSGDVYQFNIPAKSLFGKGNGNVHPFESYHKFLAANGESLDTVVTNIAYNLDAETMELQFTPMRSVTDEEYALVQQAQADPSTRQLIVLTVAQADGVTKKPAGAAAKAAVGEVEVAADEEEPEKAPRKRAPAKTTVEAKRDLANVVSEWGDDDDDE